MRHSLPARAREARGSECQVQVNRIFPALLLSRIRWNASPARAAGKTESTGTLRRPASKAGGWSARNRATISAFSARLRDRNAEPIRRARFFMRPARSSSARAPAIVEMMTILPPRASNVEVAGQRRRSDRVQHDIHGVLAPFVFRSSPQRLRSTSGSPSPRPACLIAATFSPVRVVAATRAPRYFAIWIAASPTPEAPA